VDVIDTDAGVNLGRLRSESFAFTEDGHLLVLNGAEVIEFNLGSSSGSRVPPKVHIASVQVNGIDLYATRHRKCLSAFYTLERPLRLSSGERQIGITLSGNSIESEQLLYQWRLNGIDSTWSELTPTSEILYDGLPAGSYSLDMRVCDQAGNCSEVANALSFSRRKSLWQEWWFIGGIVALAILFGWWMTSIRLKLKLKTSDLEKRRLEAELNALTLEQKALQLQMNPHFIFNALQTVRSQIKGDHLESARENITHFAKLMRSMLDASRADKITLEDELEFLQAYVEVEQMTKSVPIRYTVSLSDDIEPFAIELPPMLIQPVIENAIKYGANENEIVVELGISIESEVLVVRVKDHGRGHPKQTEHKSASLDIIRNRLRHLGKGGGLEIDHKSEQGTCMTLRIPC
jgi:hypothetical protein